MTLSIPAEEMAQYKRTARARWQAEQRQRTERYDRAWQLARDAALLLKREFGVSRVVVFGSLTHEGSFHLQSDVDLAAWGLTDANWLKAIGAVLNLSNEIEINLVDTGSCWPELLAVIERDGEEM